MNVLFTLSYILGEYLSVLSYTVWRSVMLLEIIFATAAAVL